MSTTTQLTAAQAAIAALADNSNIVPATHRAAETAILTYAQAVETTQNTARASVVNSALNRPSIRPSLLLDLTSEVVDPRITYVRNDSAKSYFDRSGTMRIAGPNEWPLEWNPITGECLGRSVWEARTNLFLNSDTLATQDVTVTAVQHTISFYGTGTIVLSGAATGTLVGTGALNQVSLTFTPTAGVLTATVTGTVRWANCTVGVFATPWIPTTSAPVLRNAEAPLITPSNIGGVLNPLEGTLYVSGFVSPNIDSSLGNYYVDLNNGSINARASIYEFNGTRIQMVTGGVTQFDQTIGAEPVTRIRAAFSYQENNSIAVVNGTVGTLDTACTIPPIGRLSLGIRGDHASGTQLCGHLTEVAYYPKALPITQTQQLTITGLLAGTNPNQLPTLGDLGTAARFDLRAVLAMPNRQELTIQGTGASQTVQIRRPYAFNFAIVDSSGSTVTTPPPAVCAANTNHPLVFTAPVGTILTYSITPIITA